ncbi:MAG: hypothetical protein GY778_04495, partial [bacterium]|nr:hypothetical protein [bacterium]
SAVYFLAFAPIAFAIASFTAKSSYAAGTYLAVMFISSPITNGLVDAGYDVFGLLSLDHHPRYITDWIFDTNSHLWIPERAGYDPWLSMLVIVVVATASTVLLFRRYRRLL